MKDDSGGWEGGRSPHRFQEQSTGTREPRDPQRAAVRTADARLLSKLRARLSV